MTGENPHSLKSEGSKDVFDRQFLEPWQGRQRERGREWYTREVCDRGKTESSTHLCRAVGVVYFYGLKRERSCLSTRFIH